MESLKSIGNKYTYDPFGFFSPGTPQTPDVEFDDATKGLMDFKAQRATATPDQLTDEAMKGTKEAGQNATSGALDASKNSSDALGMANQDSLYEALKRNSANNFTDTMNKMRTSQAVKSQQLGMKNVQSALQAKQMDYAAKVKNWSRNQQVKSANNAARSGAIGSVIGIVGSLVGGVAGGK